jgi:hypothetical protein
VYNELEAFIHANQHSPNHKKVLECFLDSRRTDYKTEGKVDDKSGRQKDSNIDKALAELAKYTH